MIVFLLIFIGWLIGLFTIGQYIIWLLKRNSHAGFGEIVLRNIFLGYIIVIIVQSVWSTQFTTINLVFIIASYLFYRETSPNNIEQSHSFTRIFNLQYFIILVIAAILFFLYNWLSFYHPESYLKFIFTWGDYILYGKIAESICTTGHENGFTILNNLDSYYQNPEPYHFFDLWGAAAVSKLFNLNSYISLMLIIYPTFYFLCFVGLLSLVKKVNYLSGFLSLLLLFIGGIHITHSDTIPFFNNLANISFNLLTPGPYKLSYFYVFLIIAYIVFLKNKTQGILVISLLPVANIITAPTIFPAVIILLIILYLKGNHKIIVRKSTIYTLIIIASIIIFYSINNRQSAGLAGAEISSPLKLLSSTFTIEGLITRRNIVAASILGIILLYAPYILLIVIAKDKFKFNKNITLFAILSIMISILVWALLYLELNSSQIYYDISVPIINVSIIIILLFILTDPVKKFKFYGILGIFVILLIYNASKNFNILFKRKFQEYSNAYLAEIDKTIPPNELVASIKSSASMNEMHSKYNAVYPLGDYLHLLNKGINSINIGDLNTPIDSSSSMNLERSFKAVRDGLFYRYSKKKENLGLSNDELMIKFIREWNIKYILVTDEAPLPLVIKNNAEKIVIDAKSKERLIKIK